jgi:hypothetical protein
MWVLGRGRGRRAGAGRKANHLKRLVIRPADLPMFSPEEFLEAIASKLSLAAPDSPHHQIESDTAIEGEGVDVGATND